MRLKEKLNALLEEIINDPTEYSPATMYESDYKAKLEEVYSEMRNNSLELDDIDEVEPIINGYTFNGPDNGYDLYELVKNLYYYFKLNKDSRTLEKLKNTMLYGTVVSPEFSIYLNHNILPLFDAEVAETFLKSEAWTIIQSLTIQGYIYYINNIIDEADAKHFIETDVTIKKEEPELTAIKPVKLTVEDIKKAPEPLNPEIYNNCLNSILVGYSYDKDNEAGLKSEGYDKIGEIEFDNGEIILIGAKSRDLNLYNLDIYDLVDATKNTILEEEEDICDVSVTVVNSSGILINLNFDEA